MTNLEAVIKNVARANSNGKQIKTGEFSFGELFKVQNEVLDLYHARIAKHKIAMKNEMSELVNDHITESGIPFMPYGHGIISEVRRELGLMYSESSNGYTA